MNTAALTPPPHGTVPCVETVRSRIHYKMRDYATYRFTAQESCAINIFFDLAQEFEDAEQLHILAVLILRLFFQYDAELYLKDDSGRPVLVTPVLEHPGAEPLQEIRSEIWNDGRHCYVPVYGKNAFVVVSSEAFSTDEAPMGVLALHVSRILESHELLFLEKYANRVGFCLDNKMLALRNERHVLFLRKLAHDIGHNIITPNLRLKLMLGRLEGQIGTLSAALADGSHDPVLRENLSRHQQKMAEQARDIMGTFQNSALFMESLLRQSHFDLGHYVLRPARLDICKLVVLPQFERYRPLFEERDLPVAEQQPELPAFPCMVEADYGLVSQVLANLLSNAVKYSTPTGAGKQSLVRCMVELLPDAFGRGFPGVKVSVFSSGAHISPDEAGRLFDDNFRASNAAGQYGTGHGLFFVREIIAEHKGRSGYEACEGGNCFYFILPMAG